MTEEALSGGNMGQVTRRGQTVRRPAGSWTPAVHHLLRHCRQHGITFVPELVGMTGDGREILTYLPGEVPQYPLPDCVWTTAALTSAAATLREFHDASQSCDRTGPWRSAVHEPVEVVCHNDFAPYNLVFNDGSVTGVIDFDFASPGPRIWDVAYLAYRIVPLTTDRADGFSDTERLARLQRLITEYGGSFSVLEVLAVVVERLEDLARFTEEMAAELDRPDLNDHVCLYRADAAWVRTLVASEPY